MRMGMREEAPVVKPGHLTLAQLAGHDDLITDALVDQVYFWTTIRKNRARYFACRGVREEDVTNIIRQSIAIEKDPAKATAQLLQLPGLKRYSDRLSTDQDRDHFQRHLRKYASIYMPDCPFEVSTTNRYTIDTQEAAVAARRQILKGEMIKYLSGIQVAITPKEEQDLDLTRRDFSIVMSSRKKTPSLFLGPARFANHDCDANARLTTKGSNGMAVLATRNIEVGEEITVTYGTDYFGVNNCECLCLTCESLRRNGWALSTDEHTDAEQSSLTRPSAPKIRIEEATTSSADSGAKATSPSASANGTQDLQIRKRSLADTDIDDCSQFPKHPRLGELRASNSDQYLTPGSERTSSVRHHSIVSSSSGHDRSASPALSIMEESQNSSTSTAATSVSNDGGDDNEDDPLSTANSPPAQGTDQSVQAVLPNANSNLSKPRIEVKVSVIESDSDLSELDDNFVMDNSLQQVVRRYKTRYSQLSNSCSKDKQLRDTSADGPRTRTLDLACSVNGRRPGDYALMPLLLKSSSGRWAQCNVCKADFVQIETIQTRQPCSRCDRHFKLYGYQWPKTERSGKHDNEQRILDPKLVQGCVGANEEKDTKKRKRVMKPRDARIQSISRGGSSSDNADDLLRDRIKRREMESLADTTAAQSLRGPESGQQRGRSTSSGNSKSRKSMDRKSVARKTRQDDITKGQTTTQAKKKHARNVIDDGSAANTVVKRKYVRSGKYSKFASSQKPSVATQLSARPNPSAHKGALGRQGRNQDQNQQAPPQTAKWTTQVQNVNKKTSVPTLPASKRKYIKSGKYAGVWKKYHSISHQTSRRRNKTTQAQSTSRKSVSSPKPAKPSSPTATPREHPGRRQFHSIFMKSDSALAKPYDLRTSGTPSTMHVKTGKDITQTQIMHRRQPTSTPISLPPKRSYVKSGKYVGVAALKKRQKNRASAPSASTETSTKNALHVAGKLKRPSLRKTMDEAKEEFALAHARTARELKFSQRESA